MKKLFLISLFLTIVVLFNVPVDMYAQDAQLVMVTSAGDSGAGTLREALEFASPGTVIRFSADVFPKTDPVPIRLERDELPGLESGGITIDASDAGVILMGAEGYSGTSGLKIRSANNVILGMEIIGFRDFGILIEFAGSNNTIGGTGHGQGNTIGWNDHNGIGIFGDDNLVINNHIGIDREGKTHLSNNEFGIYIGDGAVRNVIGGDFGREGNIISGNRTGGILVNKESSGTVIQGNIIGLDAAMKRNIGNSGFGIRIENSDNTLIGGEDTRFRNVISGNAGSGVDIVGSGSSGNKIIGNLIGSALFGRNGDQGVLIIEGAHDNQVGPGNIISFNDTNGITISGAGTNSNSITMNRIFQNSGAAISIERGANQGISPPQITNAGSRRAQGFAEPGQTVEIFSDSEDEARFLECITSAGFDGYFVCTIPQGAFQERMLKALATDTLGNSSALSDSIENPTLRVMQELPDIVAPSQVSMDPAVIGTNLSLAVISMVFFGFTTHIFNDLVKDSQINLSNIFEKIFPQKIKVWVRKIKPVEFSDAAKKKWLFILFWMGIIFLNALIESFLEPNSSVFDPQRIRIIFSLFLTGLVVNGLEWITDWLVRRRVVKDVKMIAQVRWFGLFAALASVFFSRMIAFTPGYILGTMGTIFLLPDLTDSEKNGKRSLVILVVIFIGGILFWLLSQLFAGIAPWIEPLFLNIFTISVQGVLFELLPVRMCEGKRVWDWNKILWFILFGVSVFTFLHTALNPDAGELQSLQQNGVQILIAVMGVYGLATLLFWIHSKYEKSRKNTEEKK